MNIVNTYDLTIATAATGTNTIFVGQNDTLMLYLPKVSTVFTSAVIQVGVRAAHSSGISALTSYLYDYVNLTPAINQATITTGGFYEIPNAGGAPYVALQFDVAATNATAGAKLMVSRISY